MIGIIPAAGKAERMNGLPKMLLPTPHGTLINVLMYRMKYSSLLTRIAIGASESTYAFLRSVPNMYFQTHKVKTETMSETVLLMREYVNGNEPVFMGMPDTYFEDVFAFVKLAAALQNGAEVAVGVFQTRPEQRSKLGMVEIAGDEVLHVYDKPTQTDLTWAWGVLAWKPRFWDLISASDPHVGYALPRALAAEMDVRAVRMDGGYWDCGTPEEYFDLITYLHQRVSP